MSEVIDDDDVDVKEGDKWITEETASPSTPSTTTSTTTTANCNDYGTNTYTHYKYFKKYLKFDASHIFNKIRIGDIGQQYNGKIVNSGCNERGRSGGNTRHVVNETMQWFDSSEDSTNKSTTQMKNNLFLLKKKQKNTKKMKTLQRATQNRSNYHSQDLYQASL
jgi:hypothetical protein